MLFFSNFLLYVVLERNRPIIFIFSLSGHFSTYFCFKWSQNGILQFFFNFFAICSEFSITHLVGTKRNETIIYIFSLSRPFPTNFCLKRSHNCIFFNFLNFFAIFYEFSITRRVGTKRNDNFYFSCFSVYSDLVRLEIKPQ